MKNLNMDEEFKKEDQIDSEVPAETAGEAADFELAKTGNSALIKDHSKLESEMYDGAEEGQLTIDLYQTPDEIILESPIAGVKPEDLDISITNESVTISGKREKERKIKEEDYFYQETYWGKFSRSIILPQEVDAEKSEAAVKNGVLSVRLPKLNRQRSKKLKVQSE